MQKFVGNVKLNLNYYSGEDLYSDGDIENEILDIVKNYKPEEYNSVINSRANWPVLYHLSPIRTNCVEWIDIEKTDSVLEIGAGCGAITGALAKKANSVTCVELSKRRSTINATRNKEFDNIEIFVGNFQTVEKDLGQFDVITLIGVLEYAQYYISSKKPYEEFLKIVLKHLKPNGKLILARENKLGMKYWAGCKEDHNGGYFESIENYPNNKGVRTFSRGELEKMFIDTGYSNHEFYYPYPDYKLPMVIYSDKFLPSIGDLRDNMRNFDGDRFILFDEGKAFDNVIENGLFPEFSNSFLVIAYK